MAHCYLAGPFRHSAIFHVGIAAKRRNTGATAVFPRVTACSAAEVVHHEIFMRGMREGSKRELSKRGVPTSANRVQLQNYSYVPFCVGALLAHDWLGALIREFIGRTLSANILLGAP